MPYVPGPVPEQYTPQYMDFELHRIAQSYNVLEGIGGLALNSDITPGGIAQSVVGPPAQLCNAWQTIAPSPLFGDGPVNTNPDPSTNNIGIQVNGIYLLNYYLSFTHELGAEILFELFIDGLGIGLGSVVDASQQTSGSSTSGTGIVSMRDGITLDLRVVTPSVSEDVVWTNGSLMVFKMRDLRTRFS